MAVEIKNIYKSETKKHFTGVVMVSTGAFPFNYKEIVYHFVVKSLYTKIEEIESKIEFAFKSKTWTPCDPEKGTYEKMSIVNDDETILFFRDDKPIKFAKRGRGKAKVMREEKKAADQAKQATNISEQALQTRSDKAI